MVLTTLDDDRTIYTPKPTSPTFTISKAMLFKLIRELKELRQKCTDPVLSQNTGVRIRLLEKMLHTGGIRFFIDQVMANKSKIDATSMLELEEEIQ